MKRNTIIGIIVVAAILAVGAVFATRKAAVAPSPSPSASTAAAATASAAGAVTVTYTDSGFSPASVTVAAGHQLTVKNASGSAMQFDSNPHPVHTDDTDLNIGPIAAGASGTATLTKTGTYKAHNHLDPSMQVTIEIK